MTCVRENYDRFLLALTALTLLICSVLIVHNIHQFGLAFSQWNAGVSQNANFPEVDLQGLKTKTAELVEPFRWSGRVVNDYALPLFVSVPYIVADSSFGEGDHAPLHPPVPNKWLIDNKQDLISSNVLEQDSDGDGFTTLEEYLGKTDPVDKDSHPPYWTKLTFTKVVHVPFRLRLEGLRVMTDGSDAIVIDTLDSDAPAYYLKVGQSVSVAERKLKIIRFEKKYTKAGGIKKDVSEVTLENQETHEQILLTKGQEINLPTTYAVLNYAWTGKTFAVRKGQEFNLKPENNVKYRCVAVTLTEVHFVKEDDQQDICVKPKGSAKQ